MEDFARNSSNRGSGAKSRRNVVCLLRTRASAENVIALAQIPVTNKQPIEDNVFEQFLFPFPG